MHIYSDEEQKYFKTKKQNLKKCFQFVSLFVFEKVFLE